MSSTALDTTGADAGHGAHYTTTGLDNRKIALWAFIGSECMLFVSLISTYLIYKGKSRVGPYPHEAWTDPATGETFKAILNIPVTSFSTFVLLMSSLAMVLAHNAVVNRHVKRTTFLARLEGNSFFWLISTALLGIVFLVCQAYEFTSFVNEGLKLSTNLFSSSFYVLTGFHGAHVTVGVLWLFTLASIDKKRGLTPAEGINVDLCALYWHFVDVIWIVIFVLLYLIK
jgi:cytochrome c oxidase subunit 3/cytochrome o ubiquinol oxidase subunit 3